MPLAGWLLSYDLNSSIKWTGSCCANLNKNIIQQIWVILAYSVLFSILINLYLERQKALLRVMLRSNRVSTQLLFSGSSSPDQRLLFFLLSMSPFLTGSLQTLFFLVCQIKSDSCCLVTQFWLGPQNQSLSLHPLLQSSHIPSCGISGRSLQQRPLSYQNQ